MLMAMTIHAQQIKVYGQVVNNEKPLAGVMIMVFERHTLYKRFTTDKTGSFRFAVGNKDYTIFFYKEGMMPDAYHIINHMETDVLKYPIYMELTATTERPDSVLIHSPLLAVANPDMVRAYIAAVYDYEHKVTRHDTAAAAARRTILRKAIEERDRFANYNETVSKDKSIITIGPDTYELLTDAKGAKQYYKNAKPISETTYTFETTRRYEGVLKNKRDVKRFEKYDAMKHLR